MSIEKVKTGAEVVKIAFDIWSALTDRNEKKKEQEKRIADLEREVERLKESKP
jgi:hypothetical protein